MNLLLLLVLAALAVADQPDPTTTSATFSTKKTQAGMKEKFEAIRCLHGDKKIARVAQLSEESQMILALMEVVHARNPPREERMRLMDAILATATDAVKKEMAFTHAKPPTARPNSN